MNIFLLAQTDGSVGNRLFGSADSFLENRTEGSAKPIIRSDTRRSKSYLANPLRTYLLRSKVTRETCHDTAKIQILTRSLTVFTPLLCQNTLVLENVSGIMYLFSDDAPLQKRV